MGIGINVNMRPEAYPEIAALATSLSREIGQDIERAPLLATLLEEAEGLYHILLDGGLGPIRQEWRSRLAMLGQRVRVEEGWVSGLALDVDEDGALLLRTDDGEVRRIMVGDAIVESGND
jgi:BirA family biotin operon repressor/biotin-[acetyl-CoA-carboxylase] ligase